MISLLSSPQGMLKKKGVRQEEVMTNASLGGGVQPMLGQVGGHAMVRDSGKGGVGSSDMQQPHTDIQQPHTPPPDPLIPTNSFAITPPLVEPLSPSLPYPSPTSSSQPTTSWGHSLIKFLLQTHKNKSVSHNINIIDPGTVLYRQTLSKSRRRGRGQQQKVGGRVNNDEEGLNKGKGAVVVGGKRLEQMFCRIRAEVQGWERIGGREKNGSYYHGNKQDDNKHHGNKNQNNSSSMSMGHITKPSSSPNPNPNNPKTLRSSSLTHIVPPRQSNNPTPPPIPLISASGVTSYRFKSMRAQSNLVYGPLSVVIVKSNQQQSAHLSEQHQTANPSSNKCAINRGNNSNNPNSKNALNHHRSLGSINTSLINKPKTTSNRSHSMNKIKKTAFIQKLTQPQLTHIPTDEYLHLVNQEKNNLQRIYGEDGVRIKRVKGLMEGLGLDRQVAEWGVDRMGQVARGGVVGGQEGEGVERGWAERRRRENGMGGKRGDDDSQMLNNRKIIVYRPKRTKKLLHQPKTQQDQPSKHNLAGSGVILKHLTFINQY